MDNRCTNENTVAVNAVNAVNENALEEIEDIEYADMQVNDLRQLKTLYEQSSTHYKKIMEDTKGMKEGDIFAVTLCMKEVENEINQIESAISQKLIISEKAK